MLISLPDKYNDDTSKYDQTVSLNGKVVSKISTGMMSGHRYNVISRTDCPLASGHAQGWGTAIECQQAACGFIASHKYVDTKLIMDVADPDYDQTKGTTGATGDMVTTDGGKTWTIDTISIDSHTYN